MRKMFIIVYDNKLHPATMPLTGGFKEKENLLISVFHSSTLTVGGSTCLGFKYG